MNLQLNYEGYEEYLIDKYPDECYPDGIHYVFRFPNDYGASVVKFPGTYGYKSDLWELAVLIFDESGDYELTYDTPITGDVLGHLTDEVVRNVLNEIKEL